ISIRRLCVRISKCSRESLSLNGERITQYTFFSVGSGTGPDTVAPVRVAVSTISFAADSIADVSYAFSRMRILFWVVAAIFVLSDLCLRLGLFGSMHLQTTGLPAGPTPEGIERAGPCGRSDPSPFRRGSLRRIGLPMGARPSD